MSTPPQRRLFGSPLDSSTVPSGEPFTDHVPNSPSPRERDKLLARGRQKLKKFQGMEADSPTRSTSPGRLRSPDPLVASPAANQQISDTASPRASLRSPDSSQRIFQTRPPSRTRPPTSPPRRPMAISTAALPGRHTPFSAAPRPSLSGSRYQGSPRRETSFRGTSPRRETTFRGTSPSFSSFSSPVLERSSFLGSRYSAPAGPVSTAAQGQSVAALQRTIAYQKAEVTLLKSMLKGLSDLGDFFVLPAPEGKRFLSSSPESPVSPDMDAGRDVSLEYGNDVVSLKAYNVMLRKRLKALERQVHDQPAFNSISPTRPALASHQDSSPASETPARDETALDKLEREKKALQAQVKKLTLQLDRLRHERSKTSASSDGAMQLQRQLKEAQAQAEASNASRASLEAQLSALQQAMASPSPMSESTSPALQLESPAQLLSRIQTLETRNSLLKTLEVTTKAQVADLTAQNETLQEQLARLAYENQELILRQARPAPVPLTPSRASPDARFKTRIEELEMLVEAKSKHLEFLLTAMDAATPGSPSSSPVKTREGHALDERYRLAEFGEDHPPTETADSPAPADGPPTLEVPKKAANKLAVGQMQEPHLASDAESKHEGTSPQAETIHSDVEASAMSSLKERCMAQAEEIQGLVQELWQMEKEGAGLIRAYEHKIRALETCTEMDHARVLAAIQDALDKHEGLSPSPELLSSSSSPSTILDRVEAVLASDRAFRAEMVGVHELLDVQHRKEEALLASRVEHVGASTPLHGPGLGTEPTGRGRTLRGIDVGVQVNLGPSGDMESLAILSGKYARLQQAMDLTQTQLAASKKVNADVKALLVSVSLRESGTAGSLQTRLADALSARADLEHENEVLRSQI